MAVLYVIYTDGSSGRIETEGGEAPVLAKPGNFVTQAAYDAHVSGLQSANAAAAAAAQAAENASAQAIYVDLLALGMPEVSAKKIASAHGTVTGPPGTPARKGVEVCSLIRQTAQLIAAGTTYQTVRFPFGAAESYDAFEMHQLTQPDGYVINGAAWDSDERSGLIWPSKSGWGTIEGLFQWEAPTGLSGAVTEYRDQVVRDPLGLTPTPNDTTGTVHSASTVGQNFFRLVWQIFVNPSTPIAVRVAHNGTGALNLNLAEFKLAIDDARPSP